MSINNLWGLSHGARLTTASAARPSSPPTNRNGPWPMWPGKALTLSPVVVPDEEVITTRGWKKKTHQWCLEGIKEWENRIQSVVWSPRHITSSGHCFQMPCILPCEAAFLPLHWRSSRFQHPYTTQFWESNKEIQRQGSDEAAQEKIQSSFTVLRLIWNAQGSLGSMGAMKCLVGKLKSDQTSNHCMLLQTLFMWAHFFPLLRMRDLSVLYFTIIHVFQIPSLLLKLNKTSNGTLPWEPCRAFDTCRGFSTLAAASKSRDIRIKSMVVSFFREENIRREENCDLRYLNEAASTPLTSDVLCPCPGACPYTWPTLYIPAHNSVTPASCAAEVGTRWDTEHLGSLSGVLPSWCHFHDRSHAHATSGIKLKSFH